MRFAVKVVPLGVLGCAAALLVACGDRNGLLSSSDSSGLQTALASVQSACAGGDAARAAVAARSFSDRVNALSPSAADRRLIVNLQQGASTLDALVARTCTATTSTTTPTVTTTTTPTTTTPTTPTTTTPTTTTPTTPTTTTPTTTTPTTTVPPDNGGGTPGGGTTPGNSGGAPGVGGGAPPGQAKQGAATP
jgi:hypothetical protein